MRKPIKYVEKAAVIAAKGVWAVFDRLNRVKPNPSAHAEVVGEAAAQVL